MIADLHRIPPAHVAARSVHRGARIGESFSIVAPVVYPPVEVTIPAVASDNTGLPAGCYQVVIDYTDRSFVHCYPALPASK
jgi:hypothetical protein